MQLIRALFIGSLASVALLVGTDAVPQAAPNALVTWGPEKSPLTFRFYDCAKDGIGSLYIKGTIELIHPDDKGGDTPAPEIVLKCDRLFFEKDSKLITKAALYVRGNLLISGAVDVENRRGAKGDDGPSDPNMYIVRKAGPGRDGRRGRNGDDAEDTSLKYPLGRNADTGEVGEAGGRGADGVTGPPASSARDGTAGAPITLKAGTYGKGTTISLTSLGGPGGKGAAGGRGVDGGDGGAGGIGGKGGNAALGRTASNGGVGGKGGDGGDGGWGGQGGDGGNGGRGGDLSVYILAENETDKGSPPAEFTYRLSGGAGGEPGLGGAPGAGGKGQPGGFGGCGGSGSTLGPIVFHPDGSCAGQGAHGIDGRDGQPGPAGKFGRQGPPGTPGDWRIGFVVEKGGH